MTMLASELHMFPCSVPRMRDATLAIMKATDQSTTISSCEAPVANSYLRLLSPKQICSSGCLMDLEPTGSITANPTGYTCTSRNPERGNVPKALWHGVES